MALANVRKREAERKAAAARGHVDKPMPGLVTKAKNLRTATQKWIDNGRPVRTPDEIKETFELHCLPCTNRNVEKGGCSLCGCPVNSDDKLRNKLRMATEGCPDTPPKFPPKVLPEKKGTS